jgi:hypothetical protein
VIHLTLILVDFLTGLIIAGAWALGAIVGGAALAVVAGFMGVSMYRRWRGRQ